MEYVYVQGEKVPALGFGTWQLTGEDCRRGTAHALAAGYRHIDTAQMYGNEDLVGEALAKAAVHRAEVFLTTKLLPDNVAPERVVPSTEQSLADLRTEYVDLLLIHWPPQDVPLEATLEQMATLRERGKVRFVGVSNFPPSWVERAAEQTTIFANQVEYHPYLSQQALLEQAARHDLMLTAYSPLARGRVLDDPTITEIAAAHGKLPAQVVLRWLVQQDQVAAIPKATAAERIDSNLDIFDFELSAAEMARIHALDRGSARGRLIDPPLAADWERDD